MKKGKGKKRQLALTIRKKKNIDYVKRHELDRFQEVQIE